MTDRFDEAPANSMILAIRRRQFDEHCAKQLARAARDTGEPQPQRFASKLPGDPLSIRGIPAVGSGAAGAIRGTRPGDRITQ